MLSMRNLIKVGALKVGDILVWNRKNQGVIEELTVDSNGKLKSVSKPILTGTYWSEDCAERRVKPREQRLCAYR
jgi:hypothetical protein